MKTLIDLIARHHPDKDGAITLIDALEMVVGMAESYLEDYETGIERGYYEGRDEDVAELARLTAALELVKG